MGEKLARLFRSRYVRFLEVELVRLREENQRLIESVMLQAGVPIVHRQEPRKQAPVQGRLLPSQIRKIYEQQSLETKEQSQ